MKIVDKHMYHGSVLIQEAEHKSITAINSLKIKKKTCRNAYGVNDKIALYLKYATEKTQAHDEYVFAFRKKTPKGFKSNQ